MKPRSIAIAVAAGLALVVWIAWLIAHSTRSESEVAEASATPAQMPVVAVTAVAPAGKSLPAPSGGVTATPAIAVSATQSKAVSTSGTTPAANTAAGAPPKIDRATAMIELQKVRTMIASYHTLMGQNPVGTNAEIMKAIMGGNPRQATLGPPPGQTLDAKGELMDPWGTPYFFHQLSGDDMEIHSAGPDRIMWTADDLVIH